LATINILRVNYQAAIWQHCLLKDPDVPCPVGYGWKLDNHQIVIDWMSGQPAPTPMLELLSCNCSKMKRA
jgi:hypothetical protein